MEVVTRKEIAVKRGVQNEASRIAFEERQRRREEEAKVEEALQAKKALVEGS